MTDDAEDRTKTCFEGKVIVRVSFPSETSCYQVYIVKVVDGQDEELLPNTNCMSIHDIKTTILETICKTNEKCFLHEASCNFVGPNPNNPDRIIFLSENEPVIKGTSLEQSLQHLLQKLDTLEGDKGKNSTTRWFIRFRYGPGLPTINLEFSFEGASGDKLRGVWRSEALLLVRR